MRFTLGFLILGACGGGGSSSGDDDGATDGGLPDAVLPTAVCTAPALLAVSSPAATVGDGTPGSCTEAALQAAADGGGVIVFDCGPDPVTITVTSQIVFAKETIIDGGGKVTLSGGGTSRIFYLDSDYNTPTPRLTVQRLSFKDGKSAAVGEDTEQGGAAIYADGGSLTVHTCVFENNKGPMSGQDVAGGAIYGFGGGDAAETLIVNSTFQGNTCSDGGAVGSLNRNLTIINSVLSNNAATGTVGNPGMGGAGGAIYMDGGNEAASLCGVTIQHNTAGAIGGGVFRVSNSHDGSFAMDKTLVDDNRVTAAMKNAGGLYLEGLALTVSNSTISHNQAHYNGGIWINACQVEMTNTTIAENTATGSNGGGIWLGNDPTGTIKNSTIANNHSTADGQVAGGIFGTGLTLVNTIVANNTAMYNPTCSDEHDSGGGNLQWPDSSLCTASPLTMDPLLGDLADNGGSTPTMKPGAGSPAIGIATGCPPTDQTGKPRGEPCTAGAVEP